jgi:hypothetical protein
LKNSDEFAIFKVHLDKCVEQCDAHKFDEYRKEELENLFNLFFLNTPKFIKDFFKQCVRSSRELRPTFEDVIFIKY